MMNPSSKPRINGELIGNYKGQVVCALGKLKNVNHQGNSFIMTLSDGAEVEVFLTDENTPTEGMVEVVGEVGGNGNQIQSHTHRALGDVEFDMNLYNEAVKLSHQYSEFCKIDGPDGNMQTA